MLSSIPVQAVLRAVQDECQMLENAVFQKRMSLDQEVISIFIFARFLNSVRIPVRLTHTVLPAAHVTAFRDIVARLIGAGELPLRAEDEFEKMFSRDSKLSNFDPAISSYSLRQKFRPGHKW